MKTVMITGASSGIGKEAAIVFLKNGWNVIATMRNPETDMELRNLPNVLLLRCDVTDLASIRQAVADGIHKFGTIDVLVNNAGFYTIGVLEAATEEQIRRQIETNLIGLIQMTKEVIPHMRNRKAGTIINLSSVAGRTSVPLQSLYHATKWGVEGFSESLQYELKPFHIRVKLIEPGVIKTDFYGRSMTVMEKKDSSDSKGTCKEYGDYPNRVVQNLIKNGNQGSSPVEVAETIYKAAKGTSRKMRYPVGKSTGILFLHAILPKRFYLYLVNAIMSKS